MSGADILDIVRARLAAMGVSKRPWILLDRAGPGVAFDDTDTLVTGQEPFPWRAIAGVIEEDLRRIGCTEVAATRDAETGVVRVAYCVR